MRYCIIGEKLKHSFSKDIHTDCGLSYVINEVKREDLEGFVKGCDYDGFNVTIPYKMDIIKYLDRVDERAKSIGAVNTVIKREGKLYGYNTDIFGMEKLLEKIGVNLKDKVVMILGSGGTCKTATALCTIKGAKKIYNLSRSGEINYKNYHQQKDVEVIINTTPVGMFPNNGEKLIELKKLPNLLGVIDCVYNPLKTALILEAESLGIACAGGLYMLVGQAFGAQEIWLNKKIPNYVIDEYYEKLLRQKRNIVLMGMPSCGKSTIGKMVAERLGREFIDTDKLIEERENKSIERIFNDDGEEYFRALEKQIIFEVSKNNSTVISVGGGAPVFEENRWALRQNACIVYIKRDLSLLVSDGRPLSKREGIDALYEKRKDVYEQFADYTVDNNGNILEAVKEIMKI